MLLLSETVLCCEAEMANVVLSLDSMDFSSVWGCTGVINIETSV